DLIEDGVGRLPYISVLAYEDFDEEMQNVRQILPITPGDSLLEAIRLGKSLGVPVHYVDRDVLAYQAQPVPAPDDYLIERIGLEEYWDRFQAQLPPADPGSPDDLREIEMAAHLRELRGRHERVLFVCGMAHLQAVLGHMSTVAPMHPGAVTQRKKTLYNLAQDSLPQALRGIPNFVYAYELSRCRLAAADYPQLLPLPLSKGGEFKAAQLAHNETARLLLDKLQGTPSDALPPETYRLCAQLVQDAVGLYAREWNEEPSPVRQHTLLRFARNLALVQGFLTPSKYQLLLAAKNTVNDDFAFQAYRLADHYPFFDENSELPELKMDGEQGEAEGETLILRLRLPPTLRESLEEGEGLELSEPAEEIEEGSWEERWEIGDHQVSHLPQDGKLEAFFEYLRNKARKILSDQQVRSHEMQASLMDGLDLRETLRNVASGKIYVKEQLPAVGDVGPVVVIFHKPGEEDQYPHTQMWYSEHMGESDLALYSTPPGINFDGPGISRCQYGGVLSLYPPTGRAQVWGNPRYGGTIGKAELLLKAAIDLSRKPIVAYVAGQGPSADLLSLAASRGIHIMYIPLDTLSADQLKRVRTFHVLADREIRPLAPMYIN
ncbi:MAG: hypothetical protein O7B79_03630, partial [SAR324 cluster bacterium]|nr:hypothetical protein [SAR324 cluster bacterium]